MDYIDFLDLDYGAYELSNDKLDFVTENVRYSSAVFNRLYYRSIRLPEGKNNLVFLLSPSFEKDVDMVASGKFLIPQTYKRIFYPLYDTGSFMGRRFRFNNGASKKNRNTLIRSKTTMSQYPAKRIVGRTENVFVSCGDYYREFAKIMSRTPMKRNYTEFYKELNRYLTTLSTEKNTTMKGNQHNNRILVIDADSFAFPIDVSFESAKTNPLFLLYLAFLRNRNLKNLEIDFDMLVCSGNMFMKFNPSTCTGKEWSVFKNALFRILKANLDDYAAKLTESEKEEIEETSKDMTVAAAVKKAVSPYTKRLSGATKQALENIVEDKLRINAAVAAKVAKETKAAQSDVSREIQKKYMSSPSGGPVRTQFTSPQEKTFRAADKTSTSSTFSLSKPTKGQPSYRQQSLFAKVAGVYQPLINGRGFLDTDDFEDEEDDMDEDRPEDYSDEEIEELEDSAKDILVTDDEVKDEVLDEIQMSTVPLTTKHAPLNSKRDAKLREAQKKVVVGKESIEEILERDASRVPIQESDKSKVMHTSNPHMKKVRFANFDKTYIDELMVRDIVSAFDFLKDLEYPFYVTDVKIQDSSNSLNFKDTWTVTLRDETNKRYTVKVDIPKFQDDRFLLIDGTRYMIMKQNFYNPLVKDTPDTVMVTTNFNKIQMQRRATKSLGEVERVFALMKKVSDSKMFQTGDSTKTNLKYISCLEYDEFSRRLFMFETKTCKICFSRDYIKEHWMSPEGLNGDEFLIGFEGTAPIIMNEDTGLDRSGRTISDIIGAHIPPEYQDIYRMSKAPKQSMYVEAKLAGEFLPVITTLCVWVGLRQTLNLMGIKWTFDEKAKRVPPANSSKKHIRFANGVLEYEAKTFAELIMNGMAKMHPEKFTFEDFETEAGYGQFIYSQFGTYNGITELRTFHEFLIDPITKQVCKDMMLPDTAAGLLIHGVKLLSDNAFVSKANDNSYRVRSIEIVPAILYNCLARQYKAHVKSGRRIPMTLKQNAVIQELLAQKTVEAYSTLNPVSEMNAMAKISTKGYKGSNSDFSYDEEKRSYDPTSIGKLAMSTDPNAGVGINRQLTLEPTIANARGYRDPVDDIDSLDDVNVFSGVELMTPGTVRGDDSIRTSIANKQSGHIMPTRGAVPALVSNGFDEAVQFYLSNDFVVNAEEDGKVVEVNEDIGFVVVEYKSGKHQAINTKPEIVKNSGGGFYLSNKMKLVHTKVGETFKKDEPLAYHEKYFRYSKMNGLRFTLGPIAKAAVMCTYNTYEDAGICTQSFAEKMATHVVYRETATFKRNNNILSMAKIGDHVNVGDPLIKFNVSVEDDELSKYLSKLNDENAELLENESKNEIKAGHPGEIVDIKVYSLLAPEMLSDSLGKVVKDYFQRGIDKKEFLEKFDNTASTMKAGYLLTDSTEPVRNRWNAIKGIKGIDVLIEFYLEHDDILGVGDKVALYGPNKQIISEVCPLGYEPYTESEPNEEVSILCPSGAISRRMTISTTKILAAGRIMVDLKKRIKKMIQFK